MTGQKHSSISTSESSVCQAFGGLIGSWPEPIDFGHEGIFHTTRRPGPCVPESHVVPWHPVRWSPFQFGVMPLQFRQVMKRVQSVEFAGVDQAHEQIADPCAVLRFMKHRVLAVHNGALQSALANVAVNGCSLL